MKQLNCCFLIVLNLKGAKLNYGFTEYDEKEKLGKRKTLHGLKTIHNDNSQIKIKLSERHFKGSIKERREDSSNNKRMRFEKTPNFVRSLGEFDTCVDNWDDMWNESTMAPMLITNYKVHYHDSVFGRDYHYITEKPEEAPNMKWSLLKDLSYVDGYTYNYWEVKEMDEEEGVHKIAHLLSETNKKEVMFYIHGWNQDVYSYLCSVDKLNRNSDYLVIPIIWNVDRALISNSPTDFDYAYDRFETAPPAARELAKRFKNFFSKIPRKDWLCHSMGCYITQQFFQDVYTFYRTPNQSENVARLGEASASCTPSSYYDPKNGIDGNLDTGIHSCDPGNHKLMWQVKLNQKYNIGNVIIWNRRDGGKYRLHNTKVQILEGSKIKQEKLIQFTHGLDSPNKVLLNFDGVPGDTVRILKEPHGEILNFNEVEVYVHDDSNDAWNHEKFKNVFMVAPDVRYDLFDEYPYGSGEGKNNCNSDDWCHEDHIWRNPDCRLGGGKAIASMVNKEVFVFYNPHDYAAPVREINLAALPHISFVRGYEGGWKISIQGLLKGPRGVKDEFRDKVLVTEKANLNPQTEHSYQAFDEMIEFYNSKVRKSTATHN